MKQPDPVSTVWIAVSEESVTLLELQTFSIVCRYNYANIVTFGGCLDDFMLVACPDEGAAEQKLLFSLSKPKVRPFLFLILLNNPRKTFFFSFIFHSPNNFFPLDIGNYVTDSWLHERFRPHVTRNTTNEHFDTKRLLSIDQVYAENRNWYIFIWFIVKQNIS